MKAKSLVLFSHGKESGPWGSKIKYLANIAEQHGAIVLSPDYSGILDPDERLKMLLGMPLPEHGSMTNRVEVDGSVLLWRAQSGRFLSLYRPLA